MKMEKVVLGFSGGLDTTFCVKYLSEDKGLEVHSVVVNTGGFDAAELKKIQNWNKAELSFEVTGQQCERFIADAAMQPGEKLRLGDLDWVAHSAPGHDPHSVVLYCEKEGLLISADALWEKGFGVIFPEVDGRPGFAETRATLDMIGELDVRIVIPGHGKPFKDIKKALDVAHSRIDYLQAVPARNAENAVKVLLKFLLLDRQQIKLSEVPKLLHGIPLVAAANKYYMKFGLIHLAHWAVNQLRRAGAAEIKGDFLHNLDQGSNDAKLNIKINSNI